MMHNQITDIRPLTEAERLDAYDHAKQTVLRKIGNEPQLDEFKRLHVQEYPNWLYNTMYLLMVIVLLSGGWWSGTRLISIGYSHYHPAEEALKGTEHVLAVIGGITLFLMAETLLMVSLLALNTLGIVGYARYALLGTLVLGFGMALAGNIVMVSPSSIFAWLETITPPFTVVAITLVGEKIALQKAKETQQVKGAYKTAYEEWKASQAAPEQSTYWQSALANALKDQIIAVNGKGSGSTRRKELIAEFSIPDWEWLVARELHAERWGDHLSIDAYHQPTYSNGHHPVNPTQLAAMPDHTTTEDKWWEN